MKEYAKKSASKMQALRILQTSNIHVDLDLTELERLQQQEMENEQAAMEVIMPVADAVQQLIWEWAPAVEEMARDQQMRDEQMA